MRGVVVVRMAAESIGVPGEFTAAVVRLPGEVAPVGATVVATHHFGIETILRHARGHPLADGIDHTADGLAAISQGRRAAHHLDALRDEGIDGHAMIRPYVGNIETADAVFQHADTVCIHAADDG